MNRTSCTDDDFGPFVRNCRDDFDFTLLFENTILATAPSALILCLVVGRVVQLYQKPRVILDRKFQLVKVIAVAVYAALQTALVAIWAQESTLKSWAALLAASLSLADALLFCLLSFLEHAHSKRPSAILILSLLVTTILDIARVRTLWLVARNALLTRFFTASLAFKVVVLLLETVEKAKYLPDDMSKGRPEETSSILNRGVFFWLNWLMLTGSRNIISLDHLYKLDQHMSAEYLGTTFLMNWRQTTYKGKHRALWATVKTLKWGLVAPIFPRIVFLAMTVSQPVLLHDLLSYLSLPAETASKNEGYGLIAAYALVYLVSALASGFYWYKHYQFLTNIRGCLVAAIGWRTAGIDILAVQDPKAAVTLMSTDVQRILDGTQRLHEAWASIIQIGIALYLLQRQMGVACVVPIIISLLCSVATAWTSSYANKRQAKWMEAVQVRLGITSAMLASMKGVKLRGLADVLAKSIAQSRQQEVKKANRWRTLLLLTVCFSFIPEYISPVATFMVYIIQAKARNETFDVARAFTTISLLTVMTEPLGGFLQAIPNLVSSVGCFDRIGEFLSSEEQRDFRDDNGISELKSASGTTINATYVETEEIELKSYPTQAIQPTSGQPVIQVTDGAFGWVENKDILTDINLTIPSNCLTFIVGPVASGKSTLCQALLGETRASKGQVKFFTSSKEVAFCHQTAHLVNGSIRENIIGFSDVDEKWYETVVDVCALKEDIAAMPKQHDTSVGSGGVNLSGGQRQKVAIARAIYARKSVLVLDDVFSGFDAGSERHVFQHAVGPNGLARRQGMTVIFATHAIKFLPFADHIVALGSDGRIVQQGSYATLRAQSGYIQSLKIDEKVTEQAGSSTQAQIETESVQTAADAHHEDLSRQLGDLAVYRYYLGSAGLVSSALMIAFGVSTSTFFNLPTFWLKLWTGNNSTQVDEHDYFYLGIYGLFWVLALASLVMLARQLLISIVSKTGLDLHRRLLQAVTNAPMGFFSATDSGTITNRFSQDLQLIDFQLPLGFVNLTFSVFVAIGQVILIVASSPWVGVTLPFILILFYLVQNFYLRTSRQLRFLDLEAKSPLYTNFLETLSGLATIRAFGWAHRNLTLNYKLLDESQRPLYLLYMIQRWLSFVLDVIVAVLATVIAALAVSQRASSGFAGVALTQVLLVNLTLRTIIVSWTEVETSIGSVSRIKNFSETTTSEHKDAETTVPSSAWPENGHVEFKELDAIYKSAPADPALKKLTLSIEPGERIGICGRSGSGKSSLVAALFRLLEIQSGTLQIDGIDLQLLPRNTIRERLNVIPQEALLLPGTVRANLDPRGESQDTALIDALKKVHLWHIFEAKGLEAELQSGNLSQGQRQLFSLASAILRRCKIVVLDEVTSNVDHETDVLMQRIIREEFANCTIIAVAHRLNTILDFDRIAVLDHGVLRELDSPQALLSRDSRFKTMYGERGSGEDVSTTSPAGPS